MKPSLLLFAIASRRSTACLGLRHRGGNFALDRTSRWLRALLSAVFLLTAGLSPCVLLEDDEAADVVLCIVGPVAGWLLADPAPLHPDAI